MKAPGTKRLKVEYDGLLSNIAFVFSLSLYAMGRFSKITKFVKYPMELDLSPYMSADAPYEVRPDQVYRNVLQAFGVCSGSSRNIAGKYRQNARAFGVLEL